MSGCIQEQQKASKGRAEFSTERMAEIESHANVALCSNHMLGSFLHRQHHFVDEMAVRVGF